MTDVELIKSKIDIVDFLSEYIHLTKAGRNFKALCPFHSERSPSFIVSPERQSWHCFGACSMGGDIVTFLEKWENIDFLEALKILAKRAGVPLSQFTPTESSKLKEKLFEINHLASEFYHYLLTSHKLGERAQKYLSERHIKKETINTFMLGYAPENWDNLIRYLVKKGYTTADIVTSGLAIKSDQGKAYDRFRGRVMFPLADSRGNIIGFSGRKLPAMSDKEAKYVNSPETPLYTKGNNLYGLSVTKEAIKKEKEAVVVEGEFDFLASFQSGVGNVVAIKGSALTEGQTILIKRYTENVILGLDSDFAGNEAARRGIEIAERGGLSVRMIELPFGKDPAECVEKSPHVWKDAVGKAVPIYDFVIHTAISKHNKEDVLGKKRIASEVVPFLSKITNPIVLSHYVKYVARELQVTEESITQAIKQGEKKILPPRASAVSHLPHDREVLLTEYFLALIIQSENPKELLTQAMSVLTISDFDILPVAQIIEGLLLHFKTHQKLDVQAFGGFLTPETVPTFDRAYLSDITSVLSRAEVLKKELLYTVKEIKKRALRRRMNVLSTQIRQKEKEGDEDEVSSLQKEQRTVLATLQQVDKLASFTVQ